MTDPDSRDAPLDVGCHAFVVDDAPQTRAFIVTALEWAGFIPHEFGLIREVEVALTVIRPSVIILDLSLGASDAIEVMESLVAARFEGKVILMSGHDEATIEEVRRIGIRQGLSMLPFLKKPFRLAELNERLETVSRITEPGSEVPDLDGALRNHWLEVWYQPKFNLEDMTVCGAEALVRLRHPRLGLFEPLAFLPPAGDPLYMPLSNYVVRRALADWSRFAQGCGWTKEQIAINLPASVLHSPNLVEGMRRHLPDMPDFPGLIAEITETEAIEDTERAREVATRLKLYNIHVSIDDFGAGFSTFARLNALPFVELKLDRSFVDGCASDNDKWTKCKAVVDLAHQFHLTAVGEGVENADDLQALIDLGYDVAQGYHFARPMTRDTFEKFVSEWHNAHRLPT